MNWFTKYAQSEAQEVGVPGENVFVKDSDPNAEDELVREAFPGDEVNAIVEEKLYLPLQKITPLPPFDLLLTLHDNYFNSFIAELASEGREELREFIQVANDYNKDLIATSTLYARQQLEGWLKRLYSACGGRGPMMEMRKDIERIIGL